MSNVTTPAAKEPRGALTNVVLAGSVSVTVTPVAFALPTFVMVNVYVSVSPGAADVTPSVLVTTRSGRKVSKVPSTRSARDEFSELDERVSTKTELRLFDS